VFGDRVLPLLGAEQIGRVDVLKPDKHALDAGARALLDEVRQLVAERVDLDDEAVAELLRLAQIDEPIKDQLPVLVAGEIVVSDEEGAQALRVVFVHDALDVVRRAAALLAPLHVDDGAERVLIGAAAAGIEVSGI